MAQSPLGSHVPRSDVLAEARARHADSVQVNISSPRSWAAPSVKGDEDELLNSDLRLIVHSPYLINPSSLNPDVRAKSRTALAQQLDAAALVGAEGLVVHAGHPTGSGTVQDAFDGWLETLSGWSSSLPILIENTATGKASPGRDLQHWADLIRFLSDNTDHVIGACFDTCHAHAGGIGDISFEQVVQAVGPLGAVHLNDSRDEADSGRDRHENLNAGHMDPAYLRAFTIDALSANVPTLVETPGGAKEQGRDVLWLRESL